MELEPQFLPTGIGSLPHVDAEEACRFVLKYMPEFPFWPQLPQRSPLENMYAQYSEGMPGIVLRPRLHIDTEQDLLAATEAVYRRYLENNTDLGQISPAFAAGLYAFERSRADVLSGAMAVKGHVTGPMSFGLAVTDQNRRPILYNDVVMDGIVKVLQMKAAWQESWLGRLGRKTIIFLDEPYMYSYGSAFFSYDREKVIGYMTEVMEGISGIKGVHCCANTDWSILLNTPVDILSFDAYSYAANLALYGEGVKTFIERGGVLAWGIIPATEGEARQETVESLVQRMENALDMLVRHGIDRERIARQSFITPACGVGSQTVEGAAYIFELTRQVSHAMRVRYGFE